MPSLPLEKNPNWNGGKTVTSHGYIKIKMHEHPFADPNGYVYEHRIIMERIIGRYLQPGEIVHHINHTKSDNSPENLALVANIKEHKICHRRSDNLRKPNEINNLIQCSCGCGEYFLKYDKSNRPRKFVVGHGKRGKLSYDPNETIECVCGCGTIIKRFDFYGRERHFISGHNTNIVNPNPRCHNNQV